MKIFFRAYACVWGRGGGGGEVVAGFFFPFGGKLHVFVLVFFYLSQNDRKE